MKHDNQEDIQLRNKLNDLCLLRLFRNTKKEFGEYIEYNLTTNNSILKIKPFTARCLYRELEKQILEDTYNEMDINEILDTYKEASDLYIHEIKKIHINPETDINLLHAYLRYVCIDHLEAPECDDKKLNKLLDAVNNHPSVHLVPLLLIMLKVLPAYTSKQGDVKDIDADFIKLHHFFTEFAQKEPSVLEMPILEIMKHDFTRHEQKNRIMLIYMAYCAINNFCGLMNATDTYDLAIHVNHNTQLPDIGEHYWYDTDYYNNTTTFWNFEQTATDNYFLYQYKFKLDLQEIHRKRFEITFFNQWNTLVLFAAKSSYVHILLKEKKQIQTDKQAWYKCEMDDKQSPLKINLCGLMAGRGILDFQSLTRLTDEKMTEQINNWKEKFNMIDTKDDSQTEEDYEFRAVPFAITKECIFIKQETENNEEMPDRYYCIRKEINEGLNKITINDFVGILTTQEKIYIGFSPISLFLDVTNNEAIEESKVELVEDVFL